MNIKTIVENSENEMLDVICTIEIKMQKLNPNKIGSWDYDLLKTLYNEDLEKAWKIYEQITEDQIQTLPNSEIYNLYRQIIMLTDIY